MAVLEKELKYQLTKKSYLRLSYFLKEDTVKVIDQENYYFDTKKLFLNKNKIGIRIRVLNHKRAELTLKYSLKRKSKGPKGFKVRWESTVPVSLASAKSLIKGKQKFSTFN